MWLPILAVQSPDILLSAQCVGASGAQRVSVTLTLDPQMRYAALGLVIILHFELGQFLPSGSM